MKDNNLLLFLNVAELPEKLLVYLPDVLLVETDEYGSKSKVASIKDEEKPYTLMNCSFAILLVRSPDLIMVNKHTLVSVKVVHSYRYDSITLKNIFPGWHNKQIALNRDYRKDFYTKIGK